MLLTYSFNTKNFITKKSFWYINIYQPSKFTQKFFIQNLSKNN